MFRQVAQGYGLFLNKVTEVPWHSCSQGKKNLKPDLAPPQKFKRSEVCTFECYPPLCSIGFVFLGWCVLAMADG